MSNDQSKNQEEGGRLKMAGSFISAVMFGPKKIGSVQAIRVSETAKDVVGFRRRKVVDRLAFWKKEVDSIRSRKTVYANETFEEAMRKYGIDEDRLKQIKFVFEKKLRWQFFFLLIAWMTAFSSIFYTGIAVFITNIFIACLFTAVRFRTAFRHWQVDKRRLGSINEFMNDGGLKRIFFYV